MLDVLLPSGSKACVHRAGDLERARKVDRSHYGNLLSLHHRRNCSPPPLRHVPRHHDIRRSGAHDRQIVCQLDTCGVFFSALGISCLSEIVAQVLNSRVVVMSDHETQGTILLSDFAVADAEHATIQVPPGIPLGHEHQQTTVHVEISTVTDAKDSEYTPSCVSENARQKHLPLSL